MEYFIAIILILLSALFSGLTLGLFSLDKHHLRRRAILGDKQAETVYDLRRNGNLLLSTLLLGNVAVNAILSVFLGTIASGVMASIMATALIFLFGEILPQAVITRYALPFGSATAPLVRLMMVLLYPITFPISFALDKLLGEEMPVVYTKKEIMSIVSEHEDSEHSPIDRDEERIVHGALQFSHLKVHEVMTTLGEVAMFSVKERLGDQLFEKINEYGHSRYPVYFDRRTDVLGILYAKDLLVEDEGITIENTKEAFETKCLRVSKIAFLDSVLTKMLRTHRHMAIVEEGKGKCVGIITLEDILEEIIQVDIEDEDDVD